MAVIQRRETKDGRVRWTLRVFIGRDLESGRREFVIKTFGRQKDAKDEATRLENMKAKGGLTAPSKEPLVKYLRRWLDEVKEGRIEPRTLHDYRGLVDRYIQRPPEGTPKIGLIPLHRLRPPAFEGLYAFMWKELGLAPRPIQYLHSVLRQALGHAVKTGAVAKNPTDHVRPPSQPHEGNGKKAMRAMSEEEAGRFLEAAREDRHEALWFVLLMGGLRPGEALGLLWDDVDLKSGKLHVQRALSRVGVKGWALKEPKTDRARRVVVLPPIAATAIGEWRTFQVEERLLLGEEYQDHGFVFATPFGQPLDGSNLYAYHFRPIMARAQLGEWEVWKAGEWVPWDRTEPLPKQKKWKRWRPAHRVYDLRHTCATLLLKRGVNPKIVSERLGHASITLTLDTYSHVLPDMQESAADELEAAFGGRVPRRA